MHIKLVTRTLLALSMFQVWNSGVTVAAPEGPTLQVMSFNIRNSYARDEENGWDFRKELVYQVIRKDSPDILGLQEANHAQLQELLVQLPEYAVIGEGAQGGERGQYSAILYRKTRYQLGDNGDFWLSETPDKPSKSWRTAHVRICTWANLTDRASGRSIYVYNTHMDDGSKLARENGAKLIMQHIHDTAKSAPFIFMGDMNAPEDSDTIAYVTDHAPTPAVDTFRILHPDKEVVGTYNGFAGKSDGAKIDYLFTSPGFQVLESAIITFNLDGRYPSDHYPVTARLQFE